MYLTHNEGKPAIVERFIRTFKNNVSKYLASISKNAFIDKLEDMINNYNNKYHRTIKVKPVYVKWKTYFNFSKEVNDKDPKFKVGDFVSTSKFKNVFTKGDLPNGSEKDFVIKNVKCTVS